jgi:hypothetical protein
MSISNWLMSLLQSKQKSDSRTKTLMHAVDVISSYGDVLEKTSTSGRRKHPINLLPWPKNEILEAIKLVKSCKENIADHKRLLTFMDKQQVKILLSNKFSEQMSASTIFLSDFVDADKAKNENTEWDEIAKIAKSLED